MANHVLLNNVDHRDLRIITTRSAAYGDNVMSTVTFPGEFRSVQAHYPIVFEKHPQTGRFQPVAMFGFRKEENLFLRPEGWDATYVPLTIERQPFLIGLQADAAERGMVVHIDLDNPRVSRSEGEPVFLKHGGISEYLDRMQSVLNAIHHGMESIPPFIEALLEHELLESFTLDIELNDGSQSRLAGFYTIHEEKLDALGADALAALNSCGYLKAMYMAIASLSNIRALIERKNAQLSKPATARGGRPRAAD
ncbi:MAG: SapC family protein [Woeseiaceae bacterium]